MQLLRTVLEFLQQNGQLLALLFTWGIFFWVWLGKRSDWARKEFLDQVNFSLNYVVDGVLTMRTLAEKSARSVWLNDMGVRKVRNAARNTTADQPFVKLTEPDDMDFVYRAVLNVMSEQFAEAYLAQSMGEPIVSEIYRFAITMERYDDIRTLKLRVIIVRESDLETLFAPNLPTAQQVRIPNKLYGARLGTLQQMHDLHMRAGQPGVMKVARVILAVRR